MVCIFAVAKQELEDFRMRKYDELKKKILWKERKLGLGRQFSGENTLPDHEDQNLHPQSPCKGWAGVAAACARVFRKQRQDLQDSMISRSWNMEGERGGFSKTPCLNKSKSRQQPRKTSTSTSGPILTSTQVYTQTCVPTYTQTHMWMCIYHTLLCVPKLRKEKKNWA